MTDTKRGPIAVYWQCGMGEACTNKERPGLHDEHKDAEWCVSDKQPAAAKRLYGSQRQWGEQP